MESIEPLNLKKETTSYEFDTLKIDAIIKDKKEYNENDSSIKSKFQFSNEEGKQSSENNTKYISEINTDTFTYIGFLSENLKKEFFGYYKYDNNDEYSGEWKEDFKEGKGVYLYFNEKEKNEEEFYLGEWNKGEKNGKGIYFWKHSNEKIKFEDSNYDVVFGNFENNEYKNGFCISKNKNDFSIYEGKYDNEKKNDDEAIFIENNDKAFLGKFIDNEMSEGRVIIFKENNEVKNSYYFEKNNDEVNPYNFEYSKNKEKDESIIQRKKELLEIDFQNKLPNIYYFIKEFISKSSNFENLKKIKLKEEFIDKIVQYLSIDLNQMN